jgi:hypothetical protein
VAFLAVAGVLMTVVVLVTVVVVVVVVPVIRCHDCELAIRAAGAANGRRLAR